MTIRRQVRFGVLFLVLFALAVIFGAGVLRTNPDASRAEIRFVRYEPSDSGCSAVIQITNANDWSIGYTLTVHRNMYGFRLKEDSLLPNQGVQVKAARSNATSVTLVTWRKEGVMHQIKSMLGDLGMAEKPVRVTWESSIWLPPCDDPASRVLP